MRTRQKAILVLRVYLSGTHLSLLRIMGKGDKRSRKGKIYRGTYGKRRPRKPKRAAKKAAKKA